LPQILNYRADFENFNLFLWNNLGFAAVKYFTFESRALNEPLNDQSIWSACAPVVGACGI
jgi:hypothetical protein